ncbi:MAG: hypothetical protein M1818_000849 [Claussenomyces sp. TS43310]|nr:MAG: hypothetical protein M1818_000849 [Claussenomyces sp. TS43310]
MFAIAQGPVKQNATDAINILSGRLQSSTLLEDRRNAIFGLRSFARQYPASVASGALRGLIASLRKDSEDIDTVKVVLETLLMLFNPDESSREASEEIALWLADEFTQRQDNVTMLLDLLETSDFYSRLYSLQLLSAILSSRTERTEECIFTAPLGISRLVAVLDEKREAIRNEGLALLTYLTPNSTELQKLIAFENAFERIFGIIKSEGSLSHGDRVVEDCLILLANLLRLNVSNQSFFRETGCVSKLARLLSDAQSDHDTVGEVAEWAEMQRSRNIYALLAVIRLFLVQGGVGTQANQTSFSQYGVLNQLLQLAFNDSTEMQIKAEALVTCADVIRGNPPLQESFARLQVTAVLQDPAGTANGGNDSSLKVYVIDGLLDLTLSVSSLHAFDARIAACECIKAYFYHHSAIRLHFLRRAIDGHNSGAEEMANVLTVLLRPAADTMPNDPYRVWLAAVLLFHLVFDDPKAKALAMNVAEGDASQGEEVVTCIQTIAANLTNDIRKGEDERVIVGYLMLLCGWLFEDPDSVNDFLGEGSNVQDLVQAVFQGRNRENSIVQGLCAMLLGIVYEFSTKDSTISRATLHSILTSRLGREQYIDRLTNLRKEPLLRDFEVLPQKLGSASSSGLPKVYFDRTFVDFAKDNFSRLIRTIDRDPEFEIPIIANGVQKGISRELVDSLRSQLEDKDKALQKIQAEIMSSERQLQQEKFDHRRAREMAQLDVTRLEKLNDALQRHHEDDLSKLRADHNSALERLQRQLQHAQRAADGEVERIRKRTDADIGDLNTIISELEGKMQKANKDHMQDLKTAHNEYTLKLESQTARLSRAEDKSKELEASSKRAHEESVKADHLLAEKEAQRAAAQSELDDLLMVFGDLEEKVAAYKKKLIALGETVSDGEDDEGDVDDKDVTRENDDID